MREDRSEILNRIAATTACEPEQVREIVRLALEALHKIAFCDERCLTGSLMECYWIFGDGACYHLGGILEEARIFHDSDIRYSEFLQRFAPDSWQQFKPVILGSVVNFTLFLQKWPTIQHLSPKYLHQSLDFRSCSFSPPGVFTL